MATGSPVYWPAIPSWVDLVIQTPHGFNRVQVKTASGDDTVRVRHLGSTNDLNPSDRYDLLAVVNQHRLWIIPASRLDGRNDITLHPKKIDDQWNWYRKR